MNPSLRFLAFLTACVLAVGATASPITPPQGAPDLSSCAAFSSAPTTQIEGLVIPSTIAVGSAGKLFLRLFATGSQNYVCDSSLSANRWTLVAPTALLQNEELDLNASGVHFFLRREDSLGGKAGWAANDVKRCGAVITKKIAEVPSPDSARDIPWLKTETTSSVGSGPLAKATFVLRVATRGGQPPEDSECGGRFENQEIYKSPYEASYLFYQEP